MIMAKLLFPELSDRDAVPYQANRANIPEQDIPAVLVRLAAGVESIGKMPHQKTDTADVYRQLADVLEQIR